MNNRYKIHVDSFLRLSELENDGFIEVPNSKELDDAVLLINKICSEELARRKKAEKDIINTLLEEFYNQAQRASKRG